MLRKIRMLLCNSGGIDGLLRDLSQCLVGLDFLLERLLQEIRRLRQPHFFSPSDQRSIARDLVMLNCLRAREETRIQCWAALEVLHDLIAFLKDTVDGVASLSARRFADKLEDALNALNLSFGFIPMMQERCAQFV